MVTYTLEQRWIILRQIDLQKMPILAKKNHLFRWSLFWSWLVGKQAKLSHLGHRKPARIHWKANAPKTSQCLVRILVQRHNWAILLWKCARTVTVNGDRYRAMLNEFLFPKIEEENIGNIWFQQDGATCHTAEAIVDVLRPVFEDRIISRRTDVVWSPRSCYLKPLNYYLWGAVKDKCVFRRQHTYIHHWSLQPFSQD